MQSFMLKLRLFFVGLCVAGAVLLCVGQLYRLQVNEHTGAQAENERRFYKVETIPATRGEILDRYGRKLVTNTVSYYVALDVTTLTRGGATSNAGLLTLLELFENTLYTDTFPVTAGPPFDYIESMSDSQRSRLDRFLTKKGWEDVTASDLMSKLRELFAVDETLDEWTARKLIGVRYELELRNLFNNIPAYRFASNIDMQMVTAIQERGLKGISAVQEAARAYSTEYAAHILGYVGAIEDYDAVKDQGYALNATIGKYGMEKALEPYLRGIEGQRTVETNAAGKITNVIETKAAQPGGNCLLTIDLRLQEATERALASRITSMQEEGRRNPEADGAEADAAAVVVIDVNSGEILAMASYPTFSLITFNADYASLVADPKAPLYNRAIAGTYAPGSTMKMSTGIAVLEAGVVTATTRIVDQGIFTKYADYTPMCGLYRSSRQTHGLMTVSDALKVSCNYYFYDTADRAGMAILEETAQHFGLGQRTGIELSGEETGTLAGPENRAAKGKVWNPGDTLQAAIGQSDNLFTPLQLANYVATLANGGTRYEAHLLKSVKSYDYSRQLVDVTPTAADTVDMSEENWRAVMQGMRAVCQPGGTANHIFGNYSIEVAGKTGSAQVNGKTNGVFVSFAPYDDPEIAVAVIVEKGDSGGNVAPIVRDIYDAYFAFSGVQMQSVPENELLR